MSNPSVNEVREATDRLEKDLLARLGLGSGASNEQIESAHEEIAQYLDRSPAGLRAWSARQAASIDEAYALLRGDRADLAAAAATLMGAAPAAADPAGLAPAPAAAKPTPSAAKPAAARNQIVVPSGGRHAMDALDDSDGDWFDETELQRAPRRSPAARKAAAAAAAAKPARGVNPLLRRAALAGAVVVAVVAVGFGGYSLGAPKATPAPSGDVQAAAFQQQVATLMQQLAANPNDIPTLAALGNLYYEAQDFQTAADWMKKVLAIDPNHVDSLLAFGAASFNLADYQAAEDSWKKVLEIDPANLEAYYDLGFLYFSDNPPKVDLVRQMWGKVVELSPESAIAKTVASHLKSLDTLASGAPSGSPAPAGSAAPQSSPAPSVAPAAAPSSEPSPKAS
jgi:tetratricopeptide (TPR) repeat protein